MEILDNLPIDLHWNVIKYVKHPTVEMIQDTYYVECVICIRRFWCLIRELGTSNYGQLPLLNV
jgi:hypothetical protein